MILKLPVFKCFAERRRIATWQGRCECVEDVVCAMALSRHGRRLRQGEATAYSISVRTELAEDIARVMGDRMQLQQVLMNLMMNSIDAMKNVDGTREITIQSQRAENGHVLISVSDTGVGLPPEKAEQIIDAFKVAYEKKELPALEPGGMSYMMSKDQYLTDNGDHRWIAHLMFYTPLMDGAVWGADVPKSPVMLNPQFSGAPEPIDVFMIPAGMWSDGTASPAM